MVNGVLVHKVRIVDAAPTDLTAITDDLITDEVLTRYIANYKPANHKRQRRTNCTFVQKIAVPAQEKEKVDKMKKQNYDNDSKPWHENNTQVTINMALGVMLNGNLIDSGMISRGCRLLAKVFSGGVSPVKFVDPEVATPMLVNIGRELVQASVLLPKKYKGRPWMELLKDKKFLFLIINFPHLHWCAVLMWLMGDTYHVRVYNSMKSLRKHDRSLALCAVQACERMELEPGKDKRQKWVFHAPHDVLEQKKDCMRCGIHVLARACQVMNGEHLSHKLLHTHVQAVSDFLSVALANKNETMCANVEDVTADVAAFAS